MNQAVEEAPWEVPREIQERLPAGISIVGVKKVSDGWHEGYAVKLSAPLAPGCEPKAVLRIWRSQLSYWRLEVPTGTAVELRAQSLAREAGVPTARCSQVAGVDLKGTCARAPRGEACDWAFFDFVAHSRRPKVSGGEDAVILGTMARLHSLDLTAVDTAPLPRFEDWRGQVEYLLELAEASGLEDAARGIEGAWAAMESAAPPELPPALCHFDWHLGNLLCSSEGEPKALIDWEFAGVSDPRLDLARFCRLQRWTGDGSRCREKGSARDTQRLWEAYAIQRFGAGVDVAATLGPPEPWLALESAQVLVMCAAVCGRVARRQRGSDGPPDAVTVPRCDLGEWVEDMETAKYHLRQAGLL